MNTRPLTPAESANLASLNRAGKESALLFITAVALKKAIFDATDPVRRLLRTFGVHEYEQQAQGPKFKKVVTAYVHDADGVSRVSASLYRPKTKDGDPRMWFYGFQVRASADDVCAIFIHDRAIHVLNLTRSKVATKIATGIQDAETKFISHLLAGATAVAVELLAKLRKLAGAGLIEAVCSGPTAIGRSVESALGIQINSSRLPDYQGIELKSGRAALVGRETRATLFACVPDWHLSRCKSSKQILDEFGYQRGDQFKLYCTVSTQAPNSQGLVFEIDEAERWLWEKCRRTPPRDVAVWRLQRLEESLEAKHRETFWIKAESVRQNQKEYFRLLSVTHTRNPNVPQLERMLQDGTVTMDHLIKRKPSGGAAEKGPLFKIVRPRIPELFLGEPSIYSLS